MDDRDVRPLLPWYVDGTLPPAQQHGVEEALARSPALRAELDAWRTVRAQAKDAVTRPTSDLGWSALLARIEEEKAGRVAPLRPRRAPRWVRPALALAGALVLVQAAVICMLLSQREAMLTPPSGAQATAGALLRLTLRPSATEQQIRALLSAVNAEIASGPGPLGVYTLSVPPGTAQSASERLARANDLVESVSVLRP
jgi:anti-sigma factor RsiW